jgi:hypothetical protein
LISVRLAIDQRQQYVHLIHIQLIYGENEWTMRAVFRGRNCAGMLRGLFSVLAEQMW